MDLEQVARTTAGFTGADLENLLNEAAILAAKDGRVYLQQEDIRRAFVKVGIGAEKKSRVISDKEKKKWLTDTFAGYCTEMEGAAIAQVCYFNHIPFLIVRAISDKADDSASMDYPTFEAQAIRHSVNLMAEMLRCF